MAPRASSSLKISLSPRLVTLLESHLADELEDLRRRLSSAARPPARTRKVRQRRACAGRAPVLALASDVAAALQARGVRDASLVEGEIVIPGTSAPAPHAWVESGDRVHDHTQGEFRKVWPRELYYRVFRATRRAA